MGFEYRLSFAYPSREVVERGLSSLEGIKCVAAPIPRFEFRAEGLKAQIPDATASVEDYGLYLCVNGGHGREFLGRVVTHLAGIYGPVLVAELE